jgi:hypothetical protein
MRARGPNRKFRIINDQAWAESNHHLEERVHDAIGSLQYASMTCGAGGASGSKSVMTT